MGLTSTPAVVLRTHAYGDTSLIVKALTDELGLQTLMARGARARGGKGGAAPEVFSTGSMTFFHRPGKDMHTLRSFEPDRIRRGLTGSMVRFSGAALLAELVLRHSGAEGRTGLFEQMNLALDDLERCEDAEAAGTVLAEGWRLVDALGYRPELLRCVRCESSFADDEVGRFDFGLGGVLCAGCATGGGGPRVGPVARLDLTRMLDGEPGAGAEIAAHLRPHLRILSDFVTYHVSGSHPLPAFGYFASFLTTPHE